MIFDKNRKPDSELEKTASRISHQNRKTTHFKCKNRKTEPKIGQIRKTETPNAHAPLNWSLHIMQSIEGFKGFQRWYFELF